MHLSVSSVDELALHFIRTGIIMQEHMGSKRKRRKKSHSTVVDGLTANMTSNPYCAVKGTLNLVINMSKYGVNSTVVIYA